MVGLGLGFGFLWACFVWFDFGLDLRVYAFTGYFLACMLCFMLLEWLDLCFVSMLLFGWLFVLFGFALNLVCLYCFVGYCVGFACFVFFRLGRFSGGFLCVEVLVL